MLCLLRRKNHQLICIALCFTTHKLVIVWQNPREWPGSIKSAPNPKRNALNFFSTTTQTQISLQMKKMVSPQKSILNNHWNDKKTKALSLPNICVFATTPSFLKRILVSCVKSHVCPATEHPPKNQIPESTYGDEISPGTDPAKATRLCSTAHSGTIPTRQAPEAVCSASLTHWKGQRSPSAHRHARGSGARLQELAFAWGTTKLILGEQDIHILQQTPSVSLAEKAACSPEPKGGPQR